MSYPTNIKGYIKATTLGRTLRREVHAFQSHNELRDFISTEKDVLRAQEKLLEAQKIRHKYLGIWGKTEQTGGYQVGNTLQTINQLNYRMFDLEETFQSQSQNQYLQFLNSVLDCHQKCDDMQKEIVDVTKRLDRASDPTTRRQLEQVVQEARAKHATMMEGARKFGLAQVRAAFTNHARARAELYDQSLQLLDQQMAVLERMGIASPISSPVGSPISSPPVMRRPSPAASAPNLLQQPQPSYQSQSQLAVQPQQQQVNRNSPLYGMMKEMSISSHPQQQQQQQQQRPLSPQQQRMPSPAYQQQQSSPQQQLQRQASPQNPTQQSYDAPPQRNPPQPQYQQNQQQQYRQQPQQQQQQQQQQYQPQQQQTQQQPPKKKLTPKDFFFDSAAPASQPLDSFISN